MKLKEAIEKDDYESMKSLVEELQQELYSLGASVYQQANAASQAADDSNADSKTDGDDVIAVSYTHLTLPTKRIV